MALRDLFVRIRGNNQGLKDSLNDSSKHMESFGSIVKKIGGFLGVAFGVQALISFSKESMKLAAEAEGVKTAFAKIGNSASLMNNMLRATRGAMDDSDLMALAIKAKNVNIPLQDLSKYLEFATNRAITTGKSVGELTELIVTGLGTKSPRAMKELGLSTKDVTKAFSTSGGFMKLITEELAKMGPVADTASIRMAQLAVSIQNLKEAWGGFLNNSTLIQATITNLTGLFKMLGDEGLTAWQKLTMGPKDYEKYLNGIAERQALVDMKKGGLTPDPVPVKEIETFTKLNEKLKEYKSDLEDINILDTKKIENKLKEIAALEHLIKRLSEYNTEATKVDISNLHLPRSDDKKSTFGRTYGVTPPISNQILAGAPVNGVQSTANAMAAAWQIFNDEAQRMAIHDKAAEAWKESWKQATDEVTSMISDAFIGLWESIGKGSFEGFGDALLKNFGSFIASFGKMLVAMGTSMLLALTLMKTPTIPTALAAIAVGAAAMAIGGLMTGMASKQASNMGGGSGNSGGSSSSAGMQTIKVIVEGKIKGKDIQIINRRYLEDNN